MEAEGPEAKVLLPIAVMILIIFTKHWRKGAPRRSFPRAGTARFKSRSMATSMPCATASNAASINSRTHEGWRPATIKPWRAISASSISPPSGFGCVHLSTRPSGQQGPNRAWITTEMYRPMSIPRATQQFLGNQVSMCLLYTARTNRESPLLFGRL